MSSLTENRKYLARIIRSTVVQRIYLHQTCSGIKYNRNFAPKEIMLSLCKTVKNTFFWNEKRANKGINLTKGFDVQIVPDPIKFQ